MVRVFVTEREIVGGRLTLEAEAARHVGGALRVRPGEEIVAVTPDAVEHLCRVTQSSSREVVADVISSSPSRAEPGRKMRVCQALLKGDQFERILEYGTEMGVASFQPIWTERVVARPDAARLAQRLERWRHVCRHGAELGRRGRIPELLEPARLETAIQSAREAGMAVLLLYEGPGLPVLSAALPDRQDCCLVVGPEGGFADAEVMLARQAGAQPVSLGPRIMRPLPAVLAAVAIALDRGHDLEPKEDP